MLAKLIRPWALIGLLSAASWAAPITIIGGAVNDGDFEALVPSGFPNYRFGLVGSWTYGGGFSGFTRLSDGDFQANGNATNYAFIQQPIPTQAFSSTLSQSFNLAAISSLALSFDFGGRISGPGFGGVTNLNAYLDGSLIHSVSTTDNQLFAGTSVFLNSVSAGLHTLSFDVTAVGDNAALFDNVVLIADNPAPELNTSAAHVPLALVLLAFSLLASRRKQLASVPWPA